MSCLLPITFLPRFRKDGCNKEGPDDANETLEVARCTTVRLESPGAAEGPSPKRSFRVQAVTDLREDFVLSAPVCLISIQIPPGYTHTQ